jgi:hypothetical protein
MRIAPISRNVGLLVFCLVWVVSGPESAWAQHINVAFDIEYQAEAETWTRDAFRQEMESYLRRELRSLGDVRVGSSEEVRYPEVRISILAMGLGSSNRVVTLGVFLQCEGEFDDFAQLYEHVRGDSAKHAFLTGLVEIGLLRSQCYTEERRMLFTWTRSTDVARELQAEIARIDTQIFESLRRRRRHR